MKRRSTQPDSQLIVFLENGGRIQGVPLPGWASRLLDWLTEEYAKGVIRRLAGRHYGRIIFLEDEAATATRLWLALLAAGDATVDVLLLVHGQVGYACGIGNRRVAGDFFAGLRALRAAGLARFRLRAVYQMNCYGCSLAEEWLSLGAQAVNGSVGVNWLPEPSLSLFLRGWLAGQSFEQAVERSYQVASRVLGLVWRGESRDGRPHPKIESSRMLVFGDGRTRIV